jgi:hypothetical protein
MPTLTNKYNYPPPVVTMAEQALYQPDRQVIRCTSLISPPAIREYQLTHWNSISVDVDEFLLSGFGTAWHNYMAAFAAKVQSSTWYSEQTLQMKCGDTIIQGTLDLRSIEGAIEDYKVTSCWAFVFGKPEWEQQLNVYALLCEANGIPVTSLTINAFLRDWSSMEAQRYAPNYPARPFFRSPLRLWSLDERKEFVQRRLADHLAGLRPCTPEERWQRETTYAVMNGPNKKAARVLDTEAEAKAWIAAHGDDKKYGIVCRPGSCRRCESYCFVRSVCKYRNQQ